ncbi:MAG TPA: hypothetical protein V6C57_11300 [Coleofasciculaceae cyanobacterium]
MTQHSVACDFDWSPILQSIQLNQGQQLPTYPGDLKAALLNHAGLTHDPKGEAAYQLAREISRLSTCCDPEIVYWFSRLVDLLNLEPQDS